MILRRKFLSPFTQLAVGEPPFFLVLRLSSCCASHSVLLQDSCYYTCRATLLFIAVVPVLRTGSAPLDVSDSFDRLGYADPPGS